ncbi:MAG TPA: hemerythrin domain-containing protein [Candidatus Dorea intestinavium]|nr:hemerythrin domain-containing protein [Candidatus Dorea intestinavium]
MKSIELLVEEHENIKRMLDVVHKAAISALEGGEINVDDFKKMVDFIRRYADKTHHGKEEHFMFKVMVEELGNIAKNLVSHGMLVEHDLARLYVSQLDAALDSYKENKDTESKWAIIVAAGSYEQLLRRHIDKENGVAYPFGEKNLSPKSLEWIEEQTNEFEANEENAKERDYQLSVLTELEKKYMK